MAPGLLNVKVELARVSRVPIIGNGSVTYNLGDNLKWDASIGQAQPITAADVASAASALLYIGVCLDQQPINSINQNLPFAQVNVLTKGLVLFTVDDNSTYNPGDAVTFGAGPQLVRKTGASGTAVIGYVAPENNFTVSGSGAGPTTGIAAVAGVTQLLIYIAPQYVAVGPQV